MNNKYFNSLIDKQRLNLKLIDAIKIVIEKRKSLKLIKKSFINDKEIIDVQLSNEDNFDDSFISNKISNTLNFINIDYFQNNEYIKLVNQIVIKNKNYLLIKKIIDPFTIFECGELIAMDDDCEIYPKLYYSNTKFEFPILKSSNNDLLKLSPIDIKNDSLHINLAKGKVLLLGLKFGYFAYMCSEKENVDDVFIIEKNTDLIRIFKKCILPLFKNQNKIHIINENPLDFIDKVNDNDYSFIYCNFWENHNDGLLSYIKLLRKFATFKKSSIGFYKEDKILTFFRFSIIDVLNSLRQNKKITKLSEIDKIIFDFVEKIDVYDDEIIKDLLTVGGMKKIITFKNN